MTKQMLEGILVGFFLLVANVRIFEVFSFDMAVIFAFTLNSFVAMYSSQENRYNRLLNHKNEIEDLLTASQSALRSLLTPDTNPDGSTVGSSSSSTESDDDGPDDGPDEFADNADTPPESTGSAYGGINFETLEDINPVHLDRLGSER